MFKLKKIIIKLNIKKIILFIISILKEKRKIKNRNFFKKFNV